MERFFGLFRHMKIRNKLTIVIAMIVLFSFAFILIAQQYAFSEYDKQLHSKSSQVLNLSSAAIESQLKQLEQLSFNIVSDVQLQSVLRSLKASTSDYDDHILRQDLVDLMIGYSGSEPYIRSIQLIDSRGGETGSGNSAAISSTKKARIMQQAGEAEGGIVWLYPDASDSSLILVREVRSYINSKIDLLYLGTLIIRIDLDSIVHKLAVGDGELYILSGTDIVYPQKPSFNPTELTDKLADRTGYFTREINGETQFISHSRSSSTGWTYLNLTPYNQIFERILLIKKIVVYVFVGIFVIALLWGIRFARSLTRPIEELIGRMKLAEKGNFAEANVSAADDASIAMDEIGLLQRTFRLMVDRINILITENYSHQLLIKETQFKALQAQINPHFLYNTLESINWLAKMNKQTQISQMVEALGMLLRNSVSVREPIVTLGDEIEIVRSYITIQKFRFEERLAFSLEIPERYRSLRIPKLTLQPLVENAIQYALEPSIGVCTITIRSYETESGLSLTVEDDGPGMPANTLAKLRSGELQAGGKGIGLLNIDDRIKLSFGDGYGVQVENRPGHGTRVIVRIPKQPEG
ncbi:cache domain-containing sensor histidine kinase [Cohnella fermenti]|uniref:histidine kinase n=1 Tax=Cohnella fermenti TaxID=2565925 RepID=A0A4S4BQU8_9BACL|nr:sensor histidine kinase [Cohnella fermenti]THF77335.1 sensor histidine kinase [Cohnella fermenti]